MSWRGDALDLRLGVYRHYKGDFYLVHGVARDDADESDDAEPFVIYSRMYVREGLPMTARRITSFLGDAHDERGNPIPRFEYVGLELPPTT